MRDTGRVMVGASPELRWGNGRKAVMLVAAAAAAAVVVVIWTGDRSGDLLFSAGGRAASDTASPVSSEAAAPAKPLRLDPGVYRYTVSDLTTEVTGEDGEIVKAARPSEPRPWQFVMKGNGDWVERTTDAGPPIERAYEGGRYRTVVNGLPEEPAERPAEALQSEAAARSRGSSIAGGGPRVEFNPYGASFLLSTEAADNDEALALGNRATATTEQVACGDRMCTRVEFERDVVQPAEDAEYFRSLPWGDKNTERSLVVYEDDTQLVHIYETSFNGVTLHRFDLNARP